MRIVSEISNKELATRKAEAALGHAMRDMSANLLRIIRGAGQPTDILEQMQNAIAAMHRYYEASGDFPTADLTSRMLDPDLTWPNPTDRVHDGWDSNFDTPQELVWRREQQEHRMRKAALQITASLLVNQRLQATRGKDDFRTALATYEQAGRELEAYRRSENPKAAPKPKRVKPRSIIL